jgi:hypothetical protein
MSYETTRKVFGMLTNELDKRYEAGDPLHLKVHGKPKLHILSFKPLAYEEYGMLRNRAPYVEGSFALRGFLTTPDPSGSGVLVYSALQAGEQAYGFEMDGSDPESRLAINGLAKSLGFPSLQLT